MTNLLHLIVLSVTTFTNTTELQRWKTPAKENKVIVEYEVKPGEVLPENYQVKSDGKIYGTRTELQEYSFETETTNVVSRIFTKTLIGTEDQPLFCIVSHRNQDLELVKKLGWGFLMLRHDDMSIWADFFIADPDWTPHSQ